MTWSRLPVWRPDVVCLARQAMRHRETATTTRAMTVLHSARYLRSPERSNPEVVLTVIRDGAPVLRERLRATS